MPNDLLFKTVRATRQYLLQHLQDLTEAQWLQVPDKAGHNILWNAGHVVYSEIHLTYDRCGLPWGVPKTYEALFKGGSSPKDWQSTPSIDEVLGHLKNGPDHLYAAYSTGKMDKYEPIELVKGYSLVNIEDALAFNCMHEGVHNGMIMELRKLVGAKKG